MAKARIIIYDDGSDLHVRNSHEESFFDAVKLLFTPKIPKPPTPSLLKHTAVYLRSFKTIYLKRTTPNVNEIFGAVSFFRRYIFSDEVIYLLHKLKNVFIISGDFNNEIDEHTKLFTFFV